LERVSYQKGRYFENFLLFKSLTISNKMNYYFSLDSNFDLCETSLALAIPFFSSSLSNCAEKTDLG